MPPSTPSGVTSASAKPRERIWAAAKCSASRHVVMDWPLLVMQAFLHREIVVIMPNSGATRLHRTGTGQSRYMRKWECSHPAARR